MQPVKPREEEACNEKEEKCGTDNNCAGNKDQEMAHEAIGNLWKALCEVKQRGFQVKKNESNTLQQEPVEDHNLDDDDDDSEDAELPHGLVDSSDSEDEDPKPWRAARFRRREHGKSDNIQGPNGSIGELRPSADDGSCKGGTIGTRRWRPLQPETHEAEVNRPHGSQ